MTTFTPPTVDGACSADDVLFARYSIQVGHSVVLTDGTYVTTPYPWLGEIADLEEGVEWFQGGRTYEISDAVAAALAGDGYLPGYGYGQGGYGEGYYGGSA